MNISEAVTAIIAIQERTIHYLRGTMGYKTQIAKVLEELLATNGVGSEYMEKEAGE